MLSRSAASAVFHLRSMNPYVSAVLGSSKGSVGGGALRPCWIARAAAALPSLSRDGKRIVGVSGFAFQGTNAHVALESSANQLVAASSRSGVRVMQHKRFYVCPEFDPLVLRARGFAAGGRPGRFEFATNLESSNLAALWDHVVAGRAIIPGTAFYGVAQVAGAVLLGDDAPGFAVVGTSIAFPAPLSPLSGGGVRERELGTLVCSVGCVAGDVSIWVEGGNRPGRVGGGRRAPNVSAAVAAVVAWAAAGEAKVAAESEVAAGSEAAAEAEQAGPALSERVARVLGKASGLEGGGGAAAAPGLERAGAASALATIVGTHGDSRWSRVDPAVLDNATQLCGAALLDASPEAGEGGGGAAGRPVRIPAALGACFSAARRAEAAAGSGAALTASSVLARGPAALEAGANAALVGDVRLSDGLGATSVELIGLELKPVRGGVPVGSAAAGGKAGERAAAGARPVVYETAWLAIGEREQQEVGGVATAASASAAAVFSLPGSAGCELGVRGRAAAGSVAVVSSALERRMAVTDARRLPVEARRALVSVLEAFGLRDVAGEIGASS